MFVESSFHEFEVVVRHSCKTGKEQGGRCRLEMYPRFKQGKYEGGEVKQVKIRSKRVYPYPQRRRQEQSPVRFARIQCRRKGPSEQGPIPNTVRSQLDTPQPIPTAITSTTSHQAWYSSSSPQRTIPSAVHVPAPAHHD